MPFIIPSILQKHMLRHYSRLPFMICQASRVFLLKLGCRIEKSPAKISSDLSACLRISFSYAYSRIAIGVIRLLINQKKFILYYRVLVCSIRCT